MSNQSRRISDLRSKVQSKAKSGAESKPTDQRLLMVWGAMLLGGLALFFNLYRLQVVEATSLAEKAKSQQMIYLRPFIPRRPIVDRNGNVLATDKPVYTLFAHPKLFKVSKNAIALQLSPLLQRTPEDLVAQFNQKDSGIRVAQGLSEEVSDRITAFRADGLELIQQYSRFYPQDNLVADVVGYVDIDHRGQAGVEYSQEKLLERAVRTIRLTRSGNGMLMPDRVPEGFLRYDDLRLQLTIDSRLQRESRIALKEKMAQFHAKRGAVIVMDVRDGKLLTLATEPTYDPNNYSKFDVSLFKNWALSDLYEPGSTFKPLNVAIALETGAIDPDSRFNDSGQIRIGTWTIKNSDKRGHGSLSIAEILQVSSNVGMVQIMQRVKPQIYFGWLEKLGLRQTTTIDLPFEARSQLKGEEQFTSSSIEPATTSFGQGFSLTPIQLAQLQAALANGGKLVTPHVVQGLYDTKGQSYWLPTLPPPRQVFSPQITRTVLDMMETVVDKGTGKTAKIDNFRIAGKTGTAQKASPNGGYYSNAKITSFVGILPVESPRYVVVAVVDEPEGDAFGSTVAAPIVKSVMEALISIEKIPPSQKE